MSSATSLLKNVIASLLLLAVSTHAAPAQDYPTKPIRLIIPFPPGGSNDIVGRLIAIGVGEKLGKQVVVDNRTGASGILATELVANSPPDGYTLLWISMAYASNPAFHKLRYDPIKSFTPVAFVGQVPGILLIHPSVPVNSVKELIDYAKQHPGKLNFAHAGSGSFMHLSAALFLHSSKTDMVLVPFKGGGPAMIDIIGGHTQLAVGSVLAAMPHLKSGKLKALGVGSTKRVSAVPDIPTIDEFGLPGYQAGELVGHHRAGRHTGTDHREAAQDDRRGAVRAGLPSATRQRGRRDHQDEHGRLRQVYRVGNWPNGGRSSRNWASPRNDRGRAVGMPSVWTRTKACRGRPSHAWRCAARGARQ